MMKNVSLPKISILLQFGSEKSVQILQFWVTFVTSHFRTQKATVNLSTFEPVGEILKHDQANQWYFTKAFLDFNLFLAARMN